MFIAQMGGTGARGWKANLFSIVLVGLLAFYV